MSNVSPAVAGLVILVSIGAAQAQLFGPRPEPRAVGPNAYRSMDGDVRRAGQNAERAHSLRHASMMGMAKSMQSASSDPNAVRPGDENMNCEQIMTEMQTSGGPMVSQSTATQSKVAGEATMALMEKQNAEAKAFMARQMAIGIGAGALGMLPGGGIAGSAIMAAQQAQTQAFAEKQQTEAAPVRAQQNRRYRITTESGRGGKQSRCVVSCAIGDKTARRRKTHHHS